MIIVYSIYIYIHSLLHLFNFDGCLFENHVFLRQGDPNDGVRGAQNWVFCADRNQLGISFLVWYLEVQDT